MWGYFDDFTGKLRQIPVYQSMEPAELLPSIFPDLHYVYITRKDKVRQAVSFWRAMQTNIWAWSSDDVPVPAKEPVFNYESIRSLKHEAQWEQYFRSGQVEPFRVVYEELVDAYEETALEILDFLAIERPERLIFAERKLRKQADGITEEWVREFIEEEEKVRSDPS
jgi:LPS sulfotransferase NodH